ncbi:hypothetical protein DFQ30_008467 [Apophysomyces sp. BC1015]|nr:hypothetical protein DFQ30_008467 [Apophysomyces sp. BC1015]
MRTAWRFIEEAAMARRSIAGSDHPAPAGAQCVGACEPTERFEVVVVLRRQSGDAFKQLVDRLAAGEPGAQPLSRDEYEQRFGASPRDVRRVTDFARAHGLDVLREESQARRIVLAGTVQQFSGAFGVELQRFEHQVGAAKQHFRKPAGPIHLPDDVHEVVTAVLGLDTRVTARPHFRMGVPIKPSFKPARTLAQCFKPLELAQLYDFPSGDGAGQCIALIELGGGYDDADMREYFGALGVPVPRIVAVSVDNATNAPAGGRSGPDGEVTLDIQIAGALAPAARIAVYFAPNSESGFVDAVSQALHDKMNRPSVIAISWGAPEPSWPAQALHAFDDALQTAVALGVTVCAASGDSGSTDGVGDGVDHVDFPASSPYVLGCGGTRLIAASARIESETVWNDPAGGSTGGGVSAVFARPAWQDGLTVTMSAGTTRPLVRRGVPDVAGDADPATGYVVRVGGADTVVGGTSAVAPLWAALIARINAACDKPVGFVNAVLYRHPDAFNDVTRGDNGGYAAAPGWDACTGLGTPAGRRIAAALGG